MMMSNVAAEARQAPEMQIWDGHLHVFRAVSPEYPRDVHPIFPAELEAPVEHLISTMDAHGVAGAVVTALSPHDEYLSEVLAEYPDRLMGIGVHSEGSPSAQDVRVRAERAGLSGFRMHSLGAVGTSRFQDLETAGALRQMADQGLVLWFYSPPDQLELLRIVLEALPDIKVALNHLGFCPTGWERDDKGRPRIPTPIPPSTSETVLSYAQFPNVNVMFSAQYSFSKVPFPYEDLFPLGRGLLDAYGPQRLFWASDYPWIVEDPGYSNCLALVDLNFPELTDTDRAALLGGTVRRLLVS